MRARDCRVENGNVETYRIAIDGDTTIQNRMFSRADMSFWGFTAHDVTPPFGHVLDFWSNGRGEPHFEPLETG